MPRLNVMAHVIFSDCDCYSSVNNALSPCSADARHLFPIYFRDSHVIRSRPMKRKKGKNWRLVYNNTMYLIVIFDCHILNFKQRYVLRYVFATPALYITVCILQKFHS